MKKSLIRWTGAMTLISLLVACGGSNDNSTVKAETPNIPNVPDTPAVPDDISDPVGIANGSFEEDTAGEISPSGNWILSPNHLDQGAISTIQVIESEEGVNSYKGSKAVEIIVDTLGPNPWNVEVSYEDIPVEGGKNYEFNVWVKGAEGTNVDFWIQTPAPDYAQRDFKQEALTGVWQEIKLVASTVSADEFVRLAVHFSTDGNLNTPIYLDNFSGVIQPDIDYTPVTAQSLKALVTDLAIGVAVPAGGFGNSILNSPERQAVIEQHFNQLSAENIMKPSYLQPQQGVYDFEDADALVNYAKENSLTMHGHVFIWHSQIADWMQNFQGSKNEWIAIMEGHITQVATHFEEEGNNDTLISWDVVNEAFMDNGRYRGEKTTDDSNDQSVWYENIGSEFLALSYKAARAADPDADLYYNDYNLIWNANKLDAVIDMVKQFQANGVPIDGVGFQSHISLNSPDIETIKRQLQKVVDIRPKIKVKITELDVRMNNVGDTPLTSLTGNRAEAQKQYYHDVVQAYLGTVPADQRGGITVWGIIDSDSWLPALYPSPRLEWPLLFFNDYTPKPALQGFADALITAQ